MSNAPQLIELKCRNCGSQLDPADISPQLAAARCRHCNALFAIPTAAPVAPAEAIPRPEVGLPKGFTTRHEGADLVITRRWFTPAVFFLLFFCIFWNGFMIVWHGIAITQGMWIMSAFGLIHTAVGIAVAYSVLATFLNSTVVQAGPSGIGIRHGPLPWRGNQTLSRDQLQQLYCQEKVSRGKNGTSVRYHLTAVTPGNQRQTLIKNITDPDQAIFLEQQIEKHLGIMDTQVAGEFRH
ncbi:hypothetical protein [Haloferula rosea]|uniref:Uncharacterized protein n=1 Tax=Haloferula rosea TaxID=490093 RepID=A0A934R9Q6_9BACT|nr:hypothetical protein [Haloferula rosea]MBK1827759.1 hypothetical protein [Haloferula rosea]